MMWRRVFFKPANSDQFIWAKLTRLIDRDLVSDPSDGNDDGYVVRVQSDICFRSTIDKSYGFLEM